jgi:hypothetical protein
MIFNTLDWLYQAQIFKWTAFIITLLNRFKNMLTKRQIQNQTSQGF